MTWAFLLGPWAGFDEPYHQGLVEVCSESFRWPAYLSIVVPDRLVQGIRRFPQPRINAGAFRARLYGHEEFPPGQVRPQANYETQQTPLYYLAAGRILAILPPLSPVSELYLLRLANVALAFGVGVLCWAAAVTLGFGELAWLPAAVLAFVPGFGLDLARVGNDALCAFLIAAGVAAVLPDRTGGRLGWISSAAGGLAPWAKLFGWVVVPPLVWWQIRRRRPALAGRLFLLVVPGLLLALFSWKQSGQPLVIQENLRAAVNPGGSLFDVPWLRSFWGIAKTAVWVSGGSAFVFPNGLYGVACALLGAAFVVTATEWRKRSSEILFLAFPLVIFLGALAYHSWRMTIAYGPVGSVGWYLWSAALPASLLLSLGLVSRPRARRAVPFALVFFLALTILGDAALFADVSGRLVATSHRHLLGMQSLPLSELFGLFFESRPLAVGLGALLCAGVSWLLGVLVVFRAAESTGHPGRASS